MKRSLLIFVPVPGLSHLNSAVQTAKLLLERNDCLSITILILKFPKNRMAKNRTHQNASNPDTNSRLQFIDLPDLDETSSPASTNIDIIGHQFPQVRDIVTDIVEKSSAGNYKVAGLVLDMFCTRCIDVADEFKLPSYLFFTAGACSFSLFNFLDSLKFEHNQELTQYKNSDAELSVPCFSIPLPAKVLPAVFLNESPLATMMLNHLKRYKEVKGVMINTFYELESYAIESLSDGKTPKVYPVGPILDLSDKSDDKKNQYEAIMKWLDEQPDSSVVFLCFGSMGTFDEPQVKEIAFGLEKSGQRFLWSLRKPGPKGAMQSPTEYEDFQEVLPEGFLERTYGIGKLIGWAPQVAVLSHSAVGGFVSHCGWNSTLESVWCGVPIATFPLYAEQQLNAFEFVRELGLAVEIRVDYHKRMMMVEDEEEIVGSEEIAAAIRRLMAEDGVRLRVEEMKEKSRVALLEGGSSYNAMNRFVVDVIGNVE